MEARCHLLTCPRIAFVVDPCPAGRRIGRESRGRRVDAVTAERRRRNGHEQGLGLTTWFVVHLERLECGHNGNRPLRSERFS